MARVRLARLTRRQGRPPTPASTSTDRSGAREPRPAVANLPVRAASPGTRTRPAGGRHLIGPGTRAPAHRPGRQAGPLRTAHQL